MVCAMMDDGRCDGEDGGKSSDVSRFCNFVERRKDTSGVGAMLERVSTLHRN